LIKIFQKIESYFTPYYIKKSIPFILPIFLGVLIKFNSIGLFILPITGIKSISEGRLTNKLSSIFDSLYLPKPNDENLLVFFITAIFLVLGALYIIKDLKKLYVSNLKGNYYKESKKSDTLSRKKYYSYKRKFRKYDRFIKNSENIIFCAILILLIILYDFQIALVTLIGGITYYKIAKYRKEKRVLEQKNAPELKKQDKYIRRLNNLISGKKNRRKIRPIISSLIMLVIMFLISLRADTAISIIFIFIVRIYQNNMLSSIGSYLRKK